MTSRPVAGGSASGPATGRATGRPGAGAIASRPSAGAKAGELNACVINTSGIAGRLPEACGVASGCAYGVKAGA